MWLANEVERLAKLHTRGEGKNYVNQFRLGVVAAISVKLNEAQALANASARAESKPGALVLVNNAIAKIEARTVSVQKWADNNLNLKSRQSSVSNYNPDGYAHGKQEGNKLSLGSAHGALSSGQRKIPQ